MDDGTETLLVTTDDRKEAWATQVWEACKGQCSSCGARERLKAHPVVPVGAGGKKIVTNGILLCRTCELARDIASRSPSPASGEHTRPINFWVSRELHRKLKNGMSARYGFKSVSSLVRFLMSKYVRDSQRFGDIDLYQDNGTEVKINVWVGRDMYDRFKELAERRGVTVTDTLKGLIRMYEAEAERIVGRRQE